VQLHYQQGVSILVRKRGLEAARSGLWNFHNIRVTCRWSNLSYADMPDNCHCQDTRKVSEMRWGIKEPWQPRCLLFGSPLATCRAALLATSIGIHIQCPGFSTIFPPWNSYFSVFLSAIYFAFRFFSINCLSCQLCTQLKTTLNYVFCFTEKFRRTRNTKAES